MKWFLLCFLVLVGCVQDDNQHFCATYSFFYDQLSESESMPPDVVRQQLQADIEKYGRERDRLMLLVLEDKMNRIAGVGSETPMETCLRLQRWQSF